MNVGWIGVDLDGTLAYHGHTLEYDGTIGPPVQNMLERVKIWRRAGIEIRILTARVASNQSDPFPVHESIAAIEQWCLKHIGEVLPVTSEKDYNMIQLWDDRAVPVVCNEGLTYFERHHYATFEHWQEVWRLLGVIDRNPTTETLYNTLRAIHNDHMTRSGAYGKVTSKLSDASESVSWEVEQEGNAEQF